MSMNSTQFAQFLTQGAFVREAGVFHLMAGPFAVTPSTEEVAPPYFSVPDFFHAANAFLLKPQLSIKCTADELYMLLQDFLFENDDGVPGEMNSIGPQFDWIEPDYPDYERSFLKVQEEIISGRLQKAVPVVFAQAQGRMNAVARAQIMLKLIGAPENLYPYGYWAGDQDGIIGATPEVLMWQQSQEFRTMAMAGTQIKKADTLCGLLEDPKEMNEHQFVVDDIVAQLATLGSVQKSGPNIVELPQLWHLKTDISFSPSATTDISGLVQRLHPTPALGVAPRSFGFQWLSQFPQSEIRGRFGAPFIMKFSKDHLLALVAIRNIQWQDDVVLLGSGGGLVKESILEREWRELSAKRASVRSLLGV